MPHSSGTGELGFGLSVGRRPISASHFALNVTVEPENPAVNLDDIKCHLRVDDEVDDGIIEAAVMAATREAENYQVRSYITQTLELTMDHFPSNGFLLQMVPIIAVSSIKYQDEDDATQTVATSVFKVDIASSPGRVALKVNQEWPTTIDEINAVTVTYTAGYGDDAVDVPDDIQSAIKLMVGDMYENREGQIIGTVINENPTVKRLLDTRKVAQAY